MFSFVHLPHPHRSIFKKSKEPVDPEANGYTLEKQNWLEADTWHVWKVNNNTNTFGVLSKIGIDPDTNRICVFDANNIYDQFDDDKKLKLRDLMMGIWAIKHRKQPRDLHCVLIQSTVREDVQKLCDEVYSMMKKPNRADSLVVKADGATSEEKKAFKMLQDDNPFGHGVQNMLDEYKDLKGMRIKEFVLEQPAHQSLQINIII
ncbi:hypothetical protein BDV12DRAFT_179153, partial [Aspergillus spectabilis]